MSGALDLGEGSVESGWGFKEGCVAPSVVRSINLDEKRQSWAEQRVNEAKTLR